MEMEFKVGDLKKLISESSEFKPVIGTNVESEDKKNNGKAYSDAKKRAKDYDGGLEKDSKKERPKYEKRDGNKTTLDYNLENASDEWKKRVHTQVKGYSSEAEMNNGLAKEGDFSDNDNIYKGIKDCGQKMHDNEKAFRRTGLQAREMTADTFDRGEMYESRDGFDMRNLINTFKANEVKSVLNESTPLKTAYFKKTTFLSEGHMISRIPDEFKNEGAQFKMKDKTGNEYLIEWKNNNAKVLGHSNKEGMNESVSRMTSLMNYSTNDSKTTNSCRLNENEESFKEMLDKVRKIK